MVSGFAAGLIPLSCQPKFILSIVLRKRVELRAGVTRPAYSNDDPSRAPRFGVVSLSDAGRVGGIDLSDSEIFRRRLAAVAHFFVAHLGTLIEAAQSRFF